MPLGVRQRPRSSASPPGRGSRRGGSGPRRGPPRDLDRPGLGDGHDPQASGSCRWPRGIAEPGQQTRVPLTDRLAVGGSAPTISIAQRAGSEPGARLGRIGSQRSHRPSRSCGAGSSGCRGRSRRTTDARGRVAHRHRLTLGRPDLGRLALRRARERRLGAHLVLEILALLAIALDLGQDLAAALVERSARRRRPPRRRMVLLLRLRLESKPVAMTVTLTSSPMRSSMTVPKMMFASGSAASLMISAASLTSNRPGRCRR